MRRHGRGPARARVTGRATDHARPTQTNQTPKGLTVSLPRSPAAWRDRRETLSSAHGRPRAGCGSFRAEGRWASAGQVLGPLLGELALEHPGRLADLDQIAVGVAHVAAHLGPAVDRLSDEVGPLGLPVPVARLDIGHPQVEEAGNL